MAPFLLDNDKKISQVDEHDFNCQLDGKKLDLRKNYLKKRNAFHKDNKLNRISSLAKRELDTFDIIKRLAGLDYLFSWENSSVLDLGSGDQFLRKAIDTKGANYTPVDQSDAAFNKDK